MGTSHQPVADALAELRRVLSEMDATRIEAGGQPQGWNRLVDRAQAVHLLLRETDAGRAGITHLISDDLATVRQWCASFALAWDEPIARAELERQASGGGLWAMEARITLREFDAGRLDLDWQPSRRT